MNPELNSIVDTLMLEKSREELALGYARYEALKKKYIEQTHITTVDEMFDVLVDQHLSKNDR